VFGIIVAIGIPGRRKASLTILQVICRMVAKDRRGAKEPAAKLRGRDVMWCADGAT
jgi:hypothetical protein